MNPIFVDNTVPESLSLQAFKERLDVPLTAMVGLTRWCSGTAGLDGPGGLFQPDWGQWLWLQGQFGLRGSDCDSEGRLGWGQWLRLQGPFQLRAMMWLRGPFGLRAVTVTPRAVSAEGSDVTPRAIWIEGSDCHSEGGLTHPTLATRAPLRSRSPHVPAPPRPVPRAPTCACAERARRSPLPPGRAGPRSATGSAERPRPGRSRRRRDHSGAGRAAPCGCAGRCSRTPSPSRSSTTRASPPRPSPSSSSSTSVSAGAAVVWGSPRLSRAAAAGAQGPFLGRGSSARVGSAAGARPRRPRADTPGPGRGGGCRWPANSRCSPRPGPGEPGLPLRQR